MAGGLAGAVVPAPTDASVMAGAVGTTGPAPAAPAGPGLKAHRLPAALLGGEGLDLLPGPVSGGGPHADASGPAVSGSGSSSGPGGGSSAPGSTVTLTDAPGNVYEVQPPMRAVSAPTSDPADLVAASASDNGSTLTFAASTVAEPDPFTDHNWTEDDTYLAWLIEPTGATSPTYAVYFQVNPDGTPAGELAYEPTDNPVSCTVTLSFSNAAGYVATVPASCLPKVTSFSWLVYSNYDTTPATVDPRGLDAFGKTLPDRFDGGAPWAPTVTAAPPPQIAAAGQSTPSYWLFARDGGVFAFDAPFDGSVPGVGVHVDNVVGGSTTLDSNGYWLVGSDGGVYAFGDARFYGSMGGQPLEQPIVGMVAEPTGNGYWLVARDGGVFAFGGAGFFGSLGGEPLAQPIVAIISPDDGGYLLVGADGGVFAFGDAGYYGSLPALGVAPAGPIVGAAPTPDGRGYWLVSAGGGVYAFGDARYMGGMAGTALVGPMVGMVTTPDGGGYWLVASDGGVFSYGDTNFYGSLGGHPRTDPIVAMAVSP